MTDARIQELETQLTSLRARRAKADDDCVRSTGAHRWAEIEPYQLAIKQIDSEITDASERLAFLKSGLPEDFGKPTPAPGRAAPAPPVPVAKSSTPAESIKPGPEIVPFPADLSVERRKEIFNEQLEAVVNWAVDTNPAEKDLYAWAAARAAATIVNHSWAMDRIRSLEARIADSEAGAARKSASPSGKKLDELAARVRELEAGGLIYCGVWESTNSSYRKGAVCTHGGSAWIAAREAREGEEPGSSSAWTLAVKRGKNGRNGKDVR